MNEVMETGFQPPRRGRKPLVDARPLMARVDSLVSEQDRQAKRWVRFSTFTESECRSIRRQVIQEGYEASVTSEDGHSVIYIRRSIA